VDETYIQTQPTTDYLNRAVDKQADAVEALSHGIVAKLLHQPTVGLKDAAGTPKGERLAEALRDLFDL